ncbi:MAG TPA: GNAT family N-acetyltransferase [Gemmatimonadaceae bacterium]|jgi:GNAT superfamily N-acetyltransferase|nr:GNAT family N-acetyltransferase [Gemmatimonadaceae bacterium]
MATMRTWRAGHQADGPYPARLEDIAALNQVFSDAFTERYRRDGMVGVRVPFLNPSIWRYAIEDADGGALLWRDERDEIVAFNIVHRSGVEGWMGPLAVRPDRQSLGLGKEVVRAGVEWLKGQRAAIVGLETMPRTMDNIGFYASLGFLPGRLTITLTLDAAPGERPPLVLGRLTSAERAEAIEECAALLGRVMPGYDFTRELELTERLGLGDTLLLRAGTRLSGFALCHAIPLVEGRAREELRVLKLVLERESDVTGMVRSLSDFARRSGTRRVAFRVQTEYADAFQRLVALGGRVRWTDLRMTVAGHGERRAEGQGMVLSNWEI